MGGDVRPHQLLPSGEQRSDAAHHGVTGAGTPCGRRAQPGDDPVQGLAQPTRYPLVAHRPCSCSAAVVHPVAALRDGVGGQPIGRGEHRLTRRQVTDQRRAAVRVQLGEHVVEEQQRRLAGRVGDQAVGGELQRQCQAALLALGGVRAGREPVEHDAELVAVRTDERDRPGEVRVAPRHQRLGQSHVTPRCHIGETDRSDSPRRPLPACAGQLRVGHAPTPGSRRSTSRARGRRPAPRPRPPAWRPTRRG